MKKLNIDGTIQSVELLYNLNEALKQYEERVEKLEKNIALSKLSKREKKLLGL